MKSDAARRSAERIRKLRESGYFSVDRFLKDMRDGRPLEGPEVRLHRRGDVRPHTIYNWWRFTRISLWYRQLRGIAAFWWLRWQVWSHEEAIRVVSEQLVPMVVGAGLMSPPEGLEWLREGERRAGRWRAWFKERTFLGASKDVPEGIYDEDGTGGVCMTCEEYEHWYGGRGDSGGSQAGA